MQNFNFENTNFDNAKIIQPFLSEDNRGYFLKNFEKDIFKLNDIDFKVSEIFESKSIKGVLRGLHFQSSYPQSKLVRTVKGKIYDVIVDIRKDSSTYGKWQGFYLSDENRKMLYVPKGFAHGFLTLSEMAIITYACDGKYIPEYDDGIIWNDDVLKIVWPTHLVENVVLSERDKSFKGFREYNIGI